VCLLCFGNVEEWKAPVEPKVCKTPLEHPVGRILERSRWNIIPFPRDRWKNGMSDKWKARRLKLKVKEF